MTFYRGRLPSLLLAAFALILPIIATAQHDIPLTLAEAEDLALTQEPGQEALLARAVALAEQAVAAGQLPDPTLRVGLANYPIESGGFATEGMTQAQLGIRQSFPPGDTRQLRTQQVGWQASEMTESAAARARDVLAATRGAWLETYYWQRARSLVEESRPFFGDLADITRSLYAVGSKTQQDVLRAELELGRLDDRLIEIERRHAQARAALGQWVGTAANRPIAPKLPAWEQVPDLGTLRTGLEAHPALRAADAQVAARRAGVDIAEERFKPGWALDLGYGHRNGSLPGGEPRSDFVSLSVTVDLPVFRRNRQSRALAAALGERRAAEFRRDELARGLVSQLDAEYARWHDLNRRVVLYESRILELSADHAEAALLAYRSEAGDFADVMRGYIDELNTRLEHARLQVERAQSYAAIANLGGLPR